MGDFLWKQITVPNSLTKRTTCDYKW
jgi:hypothetical protein